MKSESTTIWRLGSVKKNNAETDSMVCTEIIITLERNKFADNAAGEKVKTEV